MSPPSSGLVRNWLCLSADQGRPDVSIAFHRRIPDPIVKRYEEQRVGWRLRLQCGDVWTGAENIRDATSRERKKGLS